MGNNTYKSNFKFLFQKVRNRLDEETIAILENLQKKTSFEIFQYWDKLSLDLYINYRSLKKSANEYLQINAEEIFKNNEFLQDCEMALDQMGFSIFPYSDDEEISLPFREEYLDNYKEFLSAFTVVIDEAIKFYKITGYVISFLISLFFYKYRSLAM